MDFDLFLRPEMITALSVSLGALLGGVVAVVSEFRRPDPKKEQETTRALVETTKAAETQALQALVREECEHINRSVWIVEKKLGDRLGAIDRKLAALEARSG